MKIPRRMKSLVEEGLVDEVLGQLKSGKEAQIYVVRCGDALRCAKVYKEAHQRSFKQAVQYQEGRKVRNSRRTRAMAPTFTAALMAMTIRQGQSGRGKCSP